MKNAKTDAALALKPLLDDFHEVNGLILKSVWQVSDDGCVIAIALTFADVSLWFRAIAADDTIDVAVENTAAFKRDGATDVSNTRVWAFVVGEPFGWGWLTVNQQGYCDGALVSFGGIIPQLLLTVKASSIKVGKIESQAIKSE